jgi:4-hydroxybenzoate polyprenyltransferase
VSVRSAVVAGSPRPAPLRSFLAFAADIKLAHSVFALPFAVSALALGRLPLPAPAQWSLLLVCMVTARSFAMGMNRFLDRKIDAANPRTQGRQIPAGRLSPWAGLGWSLGTGAAFVAAAFALGPAAGYCSVPLLCILLLYSYMKRLTWLTHWYLGLCLGLSPIAVAVALTGRAPAPVLCLGAAVCLWTGGFDVLYALQDLEFDRTQGLHSVPSRFGPLLSLWISRLSFAGMIVLLSLAGVTAAAGTLYFVGVAAVAAILAYEQVLVRDARHTGHSRNLNAAFFHANAAVSIVFGAFAILDHVLPHVFPHMLRGL